MPRKKVTTLARASATSPQRRQQDFLQATIAGQLSPQTRRAYAADIAQFLNHQTGQELAPAQWQDRQDSLDVLRQVTRADMVEYRSALAARYRPLSVNRKLAVVRSLLAEAAQQGAIPASPAAGVKGLKSSGEYQATPALSRSQARQMLDSPDASTLPGQRDKALLSLALRTGLRCAELATLTVADIGQEEGHHVLRFAGKGNKQRRVKVAVDVMRDLQAWLKASGRSQREQAPLFCPIRKLGRGAAGVYVCCEQAMSTVAVWQLVHKHLRAVVGDQAKRYGPHCLRASFITLALKGGAPLHKVQQAAGHSDPRTTMRYARLADDLDDNAADYVKLNGED
jgi:site-specific recombinase XerD